MPDESPALRPLRSSATESSEPRPRFRPRESSASSSSPSEPRPLDALPRPELPSSFGTTIGGAAASELAAVARSLTSTAAEVAVSAARSAAPPFAASGRHDVGRPAEARQRLLCPLDDEARQDAHAFRDRLPCAPQERFDRRRRDLHCACHLVVRESLDLAEEERFALAFRKLCERVPKLRDARALHRGLMGRVAATVELGVERDGQRCRHPLANPHPALVPRDRREPRRRLLGRRAGKQRAVRREEALLGRVDGLLRVSPLHPNVPSDKGVSRMARTILPSPPPQRPRPWSPPWRSRCRARPRRRSSWPPSAQAITLRTAAGAPVRSLRAGVYTGVVKDNSDEHNFRIVGPGVSKAARVSARPAP